jgi:hypothetical protein
MSVLQTDLSENEIRALRDLWNEQSKGLVAGGLPSASVLQTDLSEDEIRALRDLWNEQSKGFAAGGLPSAVVLVRPQTKEIDMTYTDTDAAKKQLAEEQKATTKSREEFVERMKGKPTPTQEENDLHALGAYFHEHEADGSGPDPSVTKQIEASKPSGGYQTRQTQPAPRAPVHPHQAS